MTWPQLVATVLLVAEYLVKVVAVGTVPENRRPSASQAWLLLILLVPVVGLPLFLLLGSPFVRGRRQQVQQRANQAIARASAERPLLPVPLDGHVRVGALVGLNRALAALPCVLGVHRGLHADYEESIAAITHAVGRARVYVNLEMYILALDASTEPLFDALRAAVRRGVTVRVLYDHLGSRGYPGYRGMHRRMTADGVAWHRMMPVDPLRGHWRRPDLRNHRKLVVVDGTRGFLGSQNMIDASYLKAANRRTGRRWVDLNVELGGEIVRSLDVVFATDWYSETGELLLPGLHADLPDPMAGDGAPDARSEPMQLLPSGPGFPTEPNLRLFVSLFYLAERSVSVVSPYFVPDESLQAAITTAAYRGVRVELFVSEQADQFMVHHAQRSYYGTLLDAGVRIYRYPKPAVLHAKFLVVDGQTAVIGSSNMDMRSFALDYEVSLFALAGPLVADLGRAADDLRAACSELTAEEWGRRPWRERYLDNVMRLTAALQ